MAKKKSAKKTATKKAKKKAVKKKDVNKSEEIRKVAESMKAKGEKPRPVPIIIELGKQGIEVSSTQVSMVLKQLGFVRKSSKRNVNCPHCDALDTCSVYDTDVSVNHEYECYECKGSYVVNWAEGTVTPTAEPDGEDLNEDEDDYTEDDESDDGSLGSAEGNSECVQQFLKCQENTAEDLFGDPIGIVINSIGMRLIPVAPGSFGMGDKEADESETKGHPIEITKPFFLGMFQVTQGEYVSVMGENPSFYKGKNRPVEHLSWEQAANFCKALSDLAAEKAAGRKYRLPTEAEWEYACRAGTDSGFNNGQDFIDCSEANFSNHCGQDSPQPTLPVGSFKPNNWGFYDMHGNVWEWCADWFDEGYYEDCPKCDPTGPRSGNHHTLRGGAASSAAFECSSFYRGEASTNDGPTYDLPADGRFEDLGDFGLRVVCELADGIS